jgi:hypothetical protein
LEEINIISTVLYAYLKAKMGRKRRQLSKIFGFQIWRQYVNKILG